MSDTDDIADLSPEKVMQELAAVAFADYADFIESTPLSNEHNFMLKDLNQIPANKRKAIKKITEKTTRYGTDTEIELHDKLRALDRLIKILGIDKDDAPIPGVAKTDTSPLKDSEALSAYEKMLKVK